MLSLLWFPLTVFTRFGRIVVDADLVEALRDLARRRPGLDVFEIEPLPAAS